MVRALTGALLASLLALAGGVATAESSRSSGGRATYEFRFVKDIHPGLYQSSPGPATWLGDVALFEARTADSRELWRSDGTTAGTRMVEDTAPEGEGRPENFVKFDGKLFFTSRSDPDRSGNLWFTDGTPRGTEHFFSATERSSGSIDDLTVAGPYLYFESHDGAGGRALWRTDGSRAGTIRLSDRPDHRYAPIAGAGNRLLYIESGTDLGSRLMSTTGRPGGATPIGDFQLSNAVDGGSKVVLGGTMGTRSGSFLSDGTRAGTRLLTDPAGRSPFFCFRSCESVSTRAGTFFTEETDSLEAQVWRVDETGGLTSIWRSADERVGLDDLAASSAGIAFATNPDGSARLWTSDGTKRGTRSLAIADLPGGTDARYVSDIVAVGAGWAFEVIEGTDTGSAHQLWVSDGRLGGSSLADQNDEGRGYGFMGARARAALISHFDPQHGTELWALRER